MRLCLLIAFMLLSVAPASAQKSYNPPPGLQSLQSSAEQGDADAQGSLAVLYHEGLGLEKDAAEAAKWFRKSAEQGHALSQYNLGYLYEQGDGVEKNPATAAGWYRKAATQGDTAAQAALGTLYREGRGVKQDDAEACFWLSLAARQGNADAHEIQALAHRLTDDEKVALKERLNYWKPVVDWKPFP